MSEYAGTLENCRPSSGKPLDNKMTRGSSREWYDVHYLLHILGYNDPLNYACTLC